MKKETHIDYLMLFKYKNFFRKKSYQYFKPLLKLLNMERKKQELNESCDNKMNLQKTITFFAVIDMELSRIIKLNKAKTACVLNDSSSSCEGNVHYSYLSLVGHEKIKERMREVR